MTDSGRTVYGGGGITPDEKFVEPKLDVLQGELLRGALFSFTRDYFAKHSRPTCPRAGCRMPASSKTCTITC